MKWAGDWKVEGIRPQWDEFVETGESRENLKISDIAHHKCPLGDTETGTQDTSRDKLTNRTPERLLL